MSTSIYPSGYDAFIDPPEPSAPGIPGTVLAVDHIDSHIQLIDAVKALQTHVGSDGETDPASIEQRLTAARGIADSAADASAAAASDAISAMDAAALSSSALADHAADTGAHDIASTLAAAIAAHASALDPHGMYALEADLGSAAILDAGTAVGDLVQVQTGGKLPALDGSDLINLPGGGGGGGDLTQAAADMLYAPIAKGVTNGDAHDHIGGDGTQIAYASLSGLPTLGTAAAAATGDFEAAGAVSTHNALAAAHGISAWGATLVDDADANTARSTLGLGTAATTASTAYEVAGAVGAHAGGTGVHTIGGVTGLQGALDAKAPTASPTFTGTVSGITKSMVGLGSVDNTSDAGKPVSTAQQTALNLKANLESPTFTGTVGGITAAMVGAPAGSGNSTGTNTGNETTTTIGALINAATSKTTPVDADRVGIWNSVSGLLEYLSWANLKTALSSVFPLLAGKSGGQTLTGDTASGGHLTLKATSHETQGLVRIDNGAVIREVASKEYVQATNGSMFTNGLGGLGDNTGMSGYAYDATDVPASVGVGSFRINVAQSARVGDQRIPIDSEKDYVLGIYAKSGDVGGANFNAANKQYLGIAMYDIDGNLIGSEHGIRYPGAAADTTLAADLNPGDATVTLTSASGWENVSASGNNRHFCWFGYVNSKGFTYPNYTYTRNTTKTLSGYTSLGAWPVGGISGNVVTLTSTWSGPALPAGAVIRPVAGGYNYLYAIISNETVPNAWTRYAVTVGGIPAATVGATRDAGNFRHGTATISLLHLVNYHGAADNNVRLAGISVSPIAKGNLESRIGVGASYKRLRDASLPDNGLAVEGKAGFGTTSPVAQVHAESTSEQFRAGYSSTQYYKSVTSSTGVTTITLVGTTPAATFSVSDATTNAVYPVFGVSKNCAGAGAAGIGARFDLKAKSSTTDDTLQASFLSISLSATHATRTNAAEIGTWDWTGYRAGFRCEADGTQVKTSVNGVSAVARASALTAEIPGDATRDELRLTELYNACKAFGIIN